MMSWKRLPWVKLLHHTNRRFVSTSYVCCQSEVRVRFGPSPTGFIHLGGLRTALYNFIFARVNNGKFVLRIEDTDQSRLVAGAAENIERMLDWTGLSPDEGPSAGGDYGPYTQSERLQIYQEHIQTLIQNGTAYRCFCTPQRIELLRKEASRSGQTPRYDNRCRHLSEEQIQEKLDKKLPYTVRFKLDDGDSFNDIVFGYHSTDTAKLEGDPILLKSDGWPTYHLANVIDDHLMEISHVLRGMEWLASTCKHLAIYKAFGWTPPQFAHLPLIINKDGSKLSKRQGDLFADHLKNSGYLPEAVVNFLTYCGGGFPDRNEILTLKELVKEFKIQDINRHPAVLQMELLDHANRGHIYRLLESTQGRDRVIKELKQEVLNQMQNRSGDSVQPRTLDDQYLLRILLANKHRINRVQDLASKDFEFLWQQPHVTSKTLNDISQEADQVLSHVQQELDLIPSDSFSNDVLIEKLKTIHKSLVSSASFGKYMKILRMTLSGLKQGPGVAEMMELLGKDEVQQRLKDTLERIR